MLTLSRSFWCENAAYVFISLWKNEYEKIRTRLICGYKRSDSQLFLQIILQKHV